MIYEAPLRQDQKDFIDKLHQFVKDNTPEKCAFVMFGVPVACLKENVPYGEIMFYSNVPEGTAVKLFMAVAKTMEKRPTPNKTRDN